MTPPVASVGRHPGLPDVGVIFSVKSTENSTTLWRQLLALPSLLGVPDVKMPRQTVLAGRVATEFNFPELPSLALVELADGVMAVGTRRAVTAAASAHDNQQGVSSNDFFGPMLDQLDSSASKAVFVSVGRLANMVTQFDPGAAHDLDPILPFIKNLTASIVANETPNQLTVRAEVLGLPNVSDIVKHIVDSAEGREGTEKTDSVSHR